MKITIGFERVKRWSQQIQCAVYVVGVLSSEPQNGRTDFRTEQLISYTVCDMCCSRGSPGSHGEVEEA